MPNQPKTPLRNFRAPDDEWRPAAEKAATEGTTLTAVLRAALREFASSESRHQEHSPNASSGLTQPSVSQTPS